MNDLKNQDNDRKEDDLRHYMIFFLYSASLGVTLATAAVRPFLGKYGRNI